MELRPCDFSLRAKYQGNVVAMVVSTAACGKDPRMFGLVKLAERIHDQWLAEDKHAAWAQRAAAEEALRRLEGAAA
jgi:hypothetical protein